MAFFAILKSRHVPPKIGVRLTVNSSGHVEMAFGSAQPGDEVIETDQATLLIVDGAIADSLREMAVDYFSPEAGEPTHSGFVLKPVECIDVGLTELSVSS